MPTTTQLVITEQSKPGVLARVASVLGAAGVNIKAFSASEGLGTAKIRRGTLRFVVADLERARIALKAQKIKFKEEPALVLSLENKPGALSEVAKHLKDARINITSGYYTPSREGGKAIVVLTVSNTKKAMEILREESLDRF
ncbi:ACT domain-containing protein [Candidatus Nitrospira bockiana]